MEATVVNRKEFLKELEWVNRFVERKTTIPILQNLMISNKGDHLELTGTDLELSGIGVIDTVQPGDKFQITVPVRNLIKYLKLVEEPEVSLHAGEKSVAESGPWDGRRRGPVERHVSRFLPRDPTHDRRTREDRRSSGCHPADAGRGIRRRVSLYAQRCLVGSASEGQRKAVSGVNGRPSTRNHGRND
jgi:DNA polymerase III beta subunit, N-terminal domain